MMRGKIQNLRDRVGRINTVLPALLAFALPLSTSAVSVVAVLILVLWCVEGRFGEKLRLIVHNPVTLAVLLFFSVLILGLLWSPDIKAGLEFLRHRWMILLLPVFVTTLRPGRRSFYINWYLAGLVLAMLITYLAWFGFVQYADVTPTHLTHKTFHVVYNPMLAFGIYLVLHRAVWGEVRGLVRKGLFALAGVMIFNMFITEGRAGQLVFFVLMALFLLQLMARHRVRAILVVVILLPLIFALGYKMSPVFCARVGKACQEVRQFRENPDTSVGMRLLFWQNSWEIIRKNPWLGVGTGGFQAAYARVNQKNSPASVATDNPHNQYVFVAVTVGVPGILALLAIFGAMFRMAVRSGPPLRYLRVAFPLFFLSIMLTESYLKVYETGFLFSFLVAVLYSCSERDEMGGGSKVNTVKKRSISYALFSLWE